MPVRLSTLAAASVLVLATGSQAIGFGRAPTTAVLGSALDFSVPLRLESDESISTACISAEVMHGDQRWYGPDLRLSLDGNGPDRVLRVRGSQPLVEPVITVQVVVNCATSRVTRRFTAFVDPPHLDRVPTVTDAAPAASATPAVSAAAPAGAPRASAPVAARRDVPSVVRVRKPAPAPGAEPVAVAPPRQRSARASTVPPPPAARTAAVDVLRLPAGASRLRLEDEAPEFFPSAPASGAARPLLPFLVDVAQAAEAAASAADRVKALETSLQQLRAESLATREQISQMRGKVADAESINRLAPWLGAALAVMAALAAWFAWRLRQLQQAQQAQWWASAQEEAAAEQAVSVDAPVAAPVPPVPPALPGGAVVASPTPAPSTPGELLMARVAEVTPSAMEQTAVIEPGGVEGLPESAPQRAVAIEELLDLEQQAEFFIVLGQDEAAIDLLMGHIRGTGGASPLPYLKLLELYRKSGDRESYERTRARFNHRFNAYASDWDEDLAAGRTLEDYPAVLRRLQRLWHEPLDAMAELEALLFRRDDGELFHLPAYRELLFLYSVVRDVYDHTDTGTGNVDVLLPLGHEEAGVSMPGEFYVGDHASVVDTAPPARAQTEPMPLDLDLGGDSRPSDDGGLSFTLEPAPPRQPR